MTRIAVVDDHPVVREGLVAALDGKGGLEVAGVFSSAEEAIAAGRRVDVILLDLELPGMNGLQAIGRLSETAAVLVLTAYGEEVEEAIRAGAKGYLLKGASLDEIERAIATLAGGGSYIDPRVASRLVAPTSQRLSDREREVLRLVARGQSNKQIATKLRISERTAKFHVTAILNKLGAENRAQAVAIAAEKRLI
ncbi:MAG: DNA-binding response regulator [Acidobacteria bacterium]|nr:MAG: DNA-binding response regulator [Acidobacteriota bacterium]